MGRAVCQAVTADPDLALVAVVDPACAGQELAGCGLVVGAGRDVMLEAGVQVAVDFTVAEAAVANAQWCAQHAVHAVVGTTGLSTEVVGRLRQQFDEGAANCVLAPNFAIGAVLMMRFAELAAPWFETVEVIELHHDAKRDAPSGTSVLTAQRVAAARAEAGRAVPARPEGPEPASRGQEVAPGVHVHSVRMRGLVAHQEVIFGTTGETLTLRHDSLDRASFMPGVILAVKQVSGRRGLTIGLDALLGL